ncbi:Alpha/Beta hydrolase protein [Xylariomycetidae sp. FL0641]|nr:Alpha/Beta hydrolase protein [Xylariomycetidae sp. FL0641]
MLLTTPTPHLLLGALALLAAAPLRAAPSAGCGQAPTLTGETAHTLTVHGQARRYFVKLPAGGGYDNTHAYKLIFTFHALGGSAAQVVAGTGGYLPWYGLPGLDAAAGEAAVYVAPDGVDRGWANAGGEDLAFVDALVAALEADLCIDDAHRYSTGFSYGAAMSYSIACARAKAFRAVAALSGGPISGCEGGGDPIAYYGQHGISDQMLPITMGRSMRDRFVKNNGCTAQSPQEPAKSSGTHIKTQYEGCDPAYPVTWVAFDGDHTPQPMDKGASNTFAANETWAFFSQFKQEQ